MDIKRLREKLGMSPEGFAAELNVSTRTVERWIKGKSKPHQVYARQLDRLARKVKT